MCRAHRPRPRHGFTLLESVVAILLINIGILALMSTTAVAARAARATRYRAAALRAARNRIEWLSATACSGAAAQGDTLAAFAVGAVERWRVSTPANGVREVWDSVGYPAQWSGDSTRWLQVETRILC